MAANNHAASFDYNSAIGSWSSPETSSSNRGGWNADGSSKSAGVFDDGTAIWAATKKTGVDWTEKESLLNPPQSQVNNNLEKRIQKPEPTISSIDGTEVWGATVRSQQQQQQQQQQQHHQQHQQQQQQPTKNDNSGNIYGIQKSQQLDQNAAYSSGATPSRDLLKQMVHQIQLAVQAGHLNAHILNQPMSTPTLQLVYQLLQQIKTLHQLQEIQQRAGIKSDMNSPSNMDLQINRIRQNISLLQKAITQQQAQSFTCGATSNNSNSCLSQQPANKGLLSAQSPTSSTSSSAWSSAFSSGDFFSQQQQQGWPVFLKTNNTGNNGGASGTGGTIAQQRPPTGLYDWSDLVSSSTLQFTNDNDPLAKQQQAAVVGSLSSTVGGGRPAPPPGLATNFGPIIGNSSAVNGIWSNLNEYTD